MRAKLAVEIDGEQHEWFAEYDRGRTEVLIVSPCRSSGSAMRKFAPTSIWSSGGSGRR
jgi:very-short-patch-repair endonuclease